MADYSLSLYYSAKGTTTPAFHSDITAKAKFWQRSIAAIGGAYGGSFRIEGSLGELQDWFYNRVGWHVEEVAGGKTWAGLIYEMDLTYLGSVRRRSLDDVYNYVKAHYVYDNVPADTAVAQDTYSVGRYGRKEEVLVLNDYPQAAAEQYRDKYLATNAWAWPRGVSASTAKGDSYLDVTVLGYWKTMGWRYSTIQTGTLGNVSAYINSIVTTDCTDYLTAGIIDTNTVQVKQSTPEPQRAWDVIAEAVELGGVDGSDSVPWRLWVDNNRRANYRKVDTSPRYAITESGLCYYSGGKVNARQVEPAVVRDMRYPTARAEPGGWLADVRDTWVERVEVDHEGNLQLTTSLYDPAEIEMQRLSAQYEREALERDEARRRQAEADALAAREAAEAWEEDKRKRDRWYRDRWYEDNGLENKEDDPAAERRRPDTY